MNPGTSRLSNSLRRNSSIMKTVIRKSSASPIVCHRVIYESKLDSHSSVASAIINESSQIIITDLLTRILLNGDAKA